MPDDLFEPVAERLRLLADATRLRILNVLREGESSVAEIVRTVGASQPNASRHLAPVAARGHRDPAPGRPAGALSHRGSLHRRHLRGDLRQPTCPRRPGGAAVPDRGGRSRGLAGAPENDDVAERDDPKGTDMATPS